ncbi:ABC transporter substrate-binding protein [Nocardioides panacihumi]|uniref:ABC transporter substrate-binding protein n=1 Tax=Nocardioides panacihumi TaxID=400774 RepID=A0ABN2QV80_9ACTN
MNSYGRLRTLITAAAVAATVTACSNTSDGGAAGVAGTDAGGAFKVSSKACPPDAAKALGKGETMKIGTTWPLSGPYAALGLPFVEGAKVAFAKVNAAGGIDGHDLQLDPKDDGYDPSKTLPAVTELVQKDKVFATLGQAGTPNVAAVQPLHEQTCTPQLFVGSGAPQFSDPAKHPWTLVGPMAYTTEAQIWADYLAENKPGAKVAYLQLDNDSGQAYADGFTAAAKEKGLTIVASEKAAVDAASVENQATNILAAKPDVVILMSIGSSCAKALGAVAAGGFKGQIITAYTCSAPDIFPVLGAAADGALFVDVSKQVTDTSDPDITQFLADVDKYGSGGDKPNDTTLLGYRYGLLLADTAKAAAAMDGGLTRVNLMNAAWHLDSKWFAAVGGAAKTDGTKDAYALETGQMLGWDAKSQKFHPVGDLLDREGKTGSYSG